MMSHKNFFRTLALVLSAAGTLLWAGSAAAVTIAPGGNGTIGTLAVGGKAGRFIQITRTDFTTGGENYLQIGEVEAFAFGQSFGTPNVEPSVTVVNTNDLALSASAGGTATATTLVGSVAHGADSALINGIRNTGGTTYNRSAVGGMVKAQIDLGSTNQLSTLRVWQRADSCCQTRLADFSVDVFADNGLGGVGAYVYTASYSGTVPTNLVATFVIPDEATIHTGDILSIDLSGATDTSDTYKVGATGLGALTIETGATLQLESLGPYQSFFVGETFNVLDFNSLTGSFSNITGVSGVVFDYSNLYTTGQISVLSVLAPEPTSLGLLSIGCMLLVSRRRRRS